MSTAEIKSVFTVFPKGSTLEVNCGNGERVETGRRKGSQVFGLGQADPAWETRGVDVYCFERNDFPEDSFDNVVVFDPCDLDTETLRQLRAVGKRNFFFNFSLETHTPEYWVTQLVDTGFFVEVAHVDLRNGFLVEALKI